MRDKTFDGYNNAEEILFKSTLSEEQTIDFIKNKISVPYDYADNTSNDKELEYTKRRLFFCEYSIHCDIVKVDNKYRLKIYYTKQNLEWAFWLFGLLALFLMYKSNLAKGLEDITSVLVFLGGLLFVLWIVNGFVEANPSQELYDACKSMKKELEATIKLELEP